ncbi:polyprenol monophosphomannose synthase [Pseudolysinimonas kribbensis]|uniref:polyprenol monophosphomannose synthase n=1 Tax=Pseudolysinimonas kribbensis TaxID=433641 RepID=UPI0031DDC220
MVPGSAPARTVVIIPTFDEIENLEGAVAAVFTADPHVAILVVDDDSPDGTGALADRLAAADPRVTVLHRTERAGLGQAYLAGFRTALAAGHEVLVEMDADGSHPASALPALLARLDAADRPGVVIGSRWVAGGEVVDWPARRRWLSEGANAYARIALRIRVRDSTAGYRAYRAETLRAIPLDDVHSHGYCFQIDMTLRTLDAGFGVAEVPITFRDRLRGTSKMSSGIVAEAMLRVTQWGLRRWFRPRSLSRTSNGSAAERSLG